MREKGRGREEGGKRREEGGRRREKEGERGEEEEGRREEERRWFVGGEGLDGGGRGRRIPLRSWLQVLRFCRFDYMHC